MQNDIDEFLETYTKAVGESSAAIFAGAGLSKPAGFVNWKELMREIAAEIRLDIDRETDLVEVAQYHVNENGGNRGKINQVLIEEFLRNTMITDNHKTLAEVVPGFVDFDSLHFRGFAWFLGGLHEVV